MCHSLCSLKEQVMWLTGSLLRARTPCTCGQDFIPEFGSLVQLGHNDELVLEALGILGNLTMADLNYLKIVEEFQLVPFVSAKLCDPRTEDDILLEVVILLGTLAIDESTAGLLTNAGIIEQLIGLLRGTVW